MVAIKIFFRWADREGYLAANPCAVLKVPQAPSERERALSDKELAEVFSLALKEPYPFGPIISLLILTGQRRGEIAALRWDWIDREERTISLPSEITKNRRRHSFPYGPLTAEVIARIPQMGELLFPASRSHVRGHPTSVFNGWPKPKEAFDKKLSRVAPYTLHDLRRTFSSQLAALGTPIHVTEKLLNHVSGTLSGVAAVYNRYSYADEMRAAVMRFEEHLRKISTLAE